VRNATLLVLYALAAVFTARFWGVGCLRLFEPGSRRPQASRCIQPHAFFRLNRVEVLRQEQLLLGLLLLLLETSTLSRFYNKANVR